MSPPDPDDPNADFESHPESDRPSPQLAIAQLVATYGLAGTLRGLHQYVQSNTALLQAVDSDRAYGWMGLAQLLKPVVDIAHRLDSDAERGR